MTPDQLVDRLHRVLVDEIRVRRPEYLRAPFTVAEIYQELVPYRTHRDRIGASMNGDYEHALLRLLAGAGDYLRIESEPARKRMEEELGSSNPNTGLFRDYAALDVRLNPALIPAESEQPAAPTAKAKPAGTEAASAAPSPPPASNGGASLFAEGEAPVALQEEAEAEPKPLASAAARPAKEARSERPARETVPAREPPESCRWCRQELPRRESLRYCPFCGTDVNLVPCPSCGEELEPEWRFCIACGTEVTVA